MNRLCDIGKFTTHNILQVAELASLAQLLPPCSPTVRNPAPDSSLKSCFSPIASASAAARRLRPLQLLLPGPIAASASTGCCSRSPFASASRPAAAPRLRPLQLLLAARSRPLRLLLPDCVRLNCCSPDCFRFDCCSPIAYPGSMFSNILRGVRGSVHVNKLKYKVARHYSPVPPHEHPTSVKHRQTDTHTLKS